MCVFRKMLENESDKIGSLKQFAENYNPIISGFLSMTSTYLNDYKCFQIKFDAADKTISVERDPELL